MSTKVSNKGTAEIPMNVRIVHRKQCIELKKQDSNISKLAGSLSSYASKKEFSDKARMSKLFAKGISRAYSIDHNM